MIGAKIELPTKSEIIQQMMAEGADAETAEQAADSVIAKVGKINTLMLAVEGAYDPIVQALHADALAVSDDERLVFVLTNMAHLCAEVMQSAAPPAIMLTITAYLLEALRHLEAERLSAAHPDRVGEFEGIKDAYKIQKPDDYTPKLGPTIKAAEDAGAFGRLNEVIFSAGR
jgi:hypothetical protein